MLLLAVATSPVARHRSSRREELEGIMYDPKHVPLYYFGDSPKVGDEVFLDVHQLNTPTGFWEGQITELGDEQTSHRKGAKCRWCVAIITDERLREMEQVQIVEHYFGRSPNGYTVYDGRAAVLELLRKREADREEIQGLQRKLKIVHETYANLMKALVMPRETADRLIRLLEGLAEKLTK